MAGCGVYAVQGLGAFHILDHVLVELGAVPLRGVPGQGVSHGGVVGRGGGVQETAEGRVGPVDGLRHERLHLVVTELGALGVVVLQNRVPEAVDDDQDCESLDFGVGVHGDGSGWRVKGWRV